MTRPAEGTTVLIRGIAARAPRLTAAAVLAGVALAAGGGLLSVSGGPSLAVPPTPRGLPGAIEAYAPYQPQQACIPVAQPGVVNFVRVVLATYPDTSSIRVNAPCSESGVSEHKEGRAWDWRVSASNAHNVAEVGALCNWLLANNAAMARRLGVMYIIWNRRIWESFRAGDGWHAYPGSVPHTDHVHFSFSWAGALAETSFWSGHVAGVDPGPLLRGSPFSAYLSTYLSFGSAGPAVGVLRHALALPSGTTFDAATQHAVMAFQRAAHLSADGIVGPQTWGALSARAMTQAAPTSSPSKPTTKPTPRPAPPSRPAPAVKPISISIPSTVAPGMRNATVVRLQRLLHVTPTSGFYGQLTYAAVTKFQSSQHLTVDGVVGPMTWRALLA